MYMEQAARTVAPSKCEEFDIHVLLWEEPLKLLPLQSSNDLRQEWKERKVGKNSQWDRALCIIIDGYPSCASFRDNQCGIAYIDTRKENPCLKGVSQQGVKVS